MTFSSPPGRPLTVCALNPSPELRPPGVIEKPGARRRTGPAGRNPRRVRSHGRPDQSANESAEDGRSDPASVIPMARRIFVAAAMFRLVAYSGRRRRGRLMVDDHMPGSLMCRSRANLYNRSRRCFRLVLGWSMFFCRMDIPGRRFHRRRRLSSVRSIPFRSGEGRSAKRSAKRERQHHFLHRVVHCRVPFVVRASPFSRSHQV